MTLNNSWFSIKEPCKQQINQYCICKNLQNDAVMWVAWVYSYRPPSSFKDKRTRSHFLVSKQYLSNWGLNQCETLITPIHATRASVHFFSIFFIVELFCWSAKLLIIDISPLFDPSKNLWNDGKEDKYFVKLMLLSCCKKTKTPNV